MTRKPRHTSHRPPSGPVAHAKPSASQPPASRPYRVRVQNRTTGQTLCDIAHPHEADALRQFNHVVRQGWQDDTGHPYQPDDLAVVYTSASGAVVQFARWRG